jgi:hypothetical protein
MKNVFENDRKHQNEIKNKKDKITLLYLILFIGLFGCCVGAVINAISS